MALTVTPTDEMKTLKVGEKIYEIVDDEARTDLNEVKADFLQNVICDTASGSVATFPDGAHSLPCKSVVAQIAPKQPGSGDPSPDNVRPISGWDAVQVEHAGKNLLKNTLGSGSSMGITYTTNDDGTITFNGIANGVFERTIGVFHLKKGVTYVINGNPYSNNSVRIQLKFAGGSSALIQQYNNQDASYTPTADGDYALTIAIANLTLTNFVVSPMVRHASYDATYEPYTGTTYSASLPQTVYGGTLDMVSGELTVLGIKDVLTVVNGVLRSSLFSEGSVQSVDVLGENVRLSLNRNSQTNNMQTASSGYNTKMANLCQHYFSHASDTAHWYINNQLYLFLPKTDVGETVETYRAFLQENPFEVYVPLATPITVSLTPHEIRSLLGANNVWADSGDSEVTYRADPTLYIQKKITEAVAALA